MINPTSRPTTFDNFSSSNKWPVTKITFRSGRMAQNSLTSLVPASLPIEKSQSIARISSAWRLKRSRAACVVSAHKTLIWKKASPTSAIKAAIAGSSSTINTASSGPFMLSLRIRTCLNSDPVRIFKSSAVALSLTRFAGGEFPDEGRWALKFWLCGLCCGQGAEFMDKYNVAELKPEDVIWETKAFAIEGMTCDNCVKHVTRALRGVNGVKSVEVDRQNARAVVTYDTTKTDMPALFEALKKSGYHGRPFADGDTA